MNHLYDFYLLQFILRKTSYYFWGEEVYDSIRLNPQLIHIISLACPSSTQASHCSQFLEDNDRFYAISRERTAPLILFYRLLILSIHAALHKTEIINQIEYTIIWLFVPSYLQIVQEFFKNNCQEFEQADKLYFHQHFHK